jgi:AAA+ superfamily predicted ATPase
VKFPKPTREEIETLLCRQFKQITVGHAVNLADTARNLEGFSHADVERAAHDAIKQSLLLGKDQVEADVLSAAIARQRERFTITDSSLGPTEPMLKRPRARKKKSD